MGPLVLYFALTYLLSWTCWAGATALARDAASPTAMVVTPIVLKPVRTGEARGYVAEGSISIDPATLRDGRVDNDGCGGRI